MSDEQRYSNQDRERLAKLNTRHIEVQATMDWHNGLCRIVVQDGLKLPAAVDVPFLAIKEIAVNMLIGECRMARGLAPVLGPNNNKPEG